MLWRVWRSRRPLHDDSALPPRASNGSHYAVPGVSLSWSDDKAATDCAKHGVTFDRATLAVRDAFAIERFDDRQSYGEERVNLAGMREGVLLHVTYTERDGRIHIISARQAERHGQDNYHRENSG